MLSPCPPGRLVQVHVDAHKDLESPSSDPSLYVTRLAYTIHACSLLVIAPTDTVEQVRRMTYRVAPILLTSGTDGAQPRVGATRVPDR